jgi:drug/metabolite transporter (DMT)-like permease
MAMDRRRTALVLLLAFLACIGVAVVVSGGRPGLQQGIAPTVVDLVGYLFALVAAVLLLAPTAEGTDGDSRTVGAAVLGAVVVLVLLDLLVEHGPSIGAGFVRLIALVVIVVATVRLARRDGVAGRLR